MTQPWNLGRYLAFHGLLWLCLAGSASATSVTGQVYLDQNQNGVRDSAEHGLAGVAISNGRDVVRSDTQGRYQIELRDGDTLFVIKPANYQFHRGADGSLRYWQHRAPDGVGQELRYGGIGPSQADGQFGLIAEADDSAESPLEVLVLADPQPKTQRDVEYFRRDIVQPIIGKHGAALGVVLGDVVNDDLILFDGIAEALGQLSVPWLVVSGNHDIDFDAADDAQSLLSFRQRFGPDTFAWETPQAVFIALDDVIYHGSQTRRYVGGLRDDQFEFLHNYLKDMDEQRLLVLMLHIPLFNTYRDDDSFRPADRQRLFDLLSRFPRRLILSGHTHAQRHHFHDQQSGWKGATPLHEYNVGTACGGYWSGPFDAAGIPDARMADGTPNGFATLRIDGSGDYQLRYQAARQSDHPGIELSGPAVLRKGSWPGVGLYANVLMGWADTRVEIRIDQGEWRPMRYSPGFDRQVLLENLLDDQAAALRGYDRLPEAEVSQHRWRSALPTDLALGTHEVEVRAFDPWVGELRARTEYRLVESP